jgi:hypothetical protein
MFQQVTVKLRNVSKNYSRDNMQQQIINMYHVYYCGSCAI